MPLLPPASRMNISNPKAAKVRKAPKVLFSSLSAKFALYQAVLQDLRKYHPEAIVLGVDSNPYCPAAAKVDHFSHLPPLDQLSDDQLMNFCRSHEITHILPSRDGELAYWSSRKNWLKKSGIEAWVSDPDYVEFCGDKLLFHDAWRESPVPPIPTHTSLPKASSTRWVVKERFGSGSVSLGINLSFSEAQIFSKSLDRPIYQPFIEGREFTAETWIDQQGSCHGVLLRWRDHVVDGESHHTTVFNHAEWSKLMEKVFLFHPGAWGHCLAQVLVDHSGYLHLVEINPRLGGASPLSLHAGLNSIQWHLMEGADELETIPQDPCFAIGKTLIKKEGCVMIQN